MNLTIISAPPFEPVSLTEVYSQLRLTPDHAGSPGEETHEDDVMLAGQIKAAREFVEKATRRSLVQRTVRLSHSAFPRYCYGWQPPFRQQMVDRIWLFRPPLIRVERVQYYDGENTLQTVAPADYYTTDDLVPELRFASTFAAPTTYDRPDAVRVEYVAGYAPSGSPSTELADYVGNIPETLRQAVLIGVQLLYDAMTPGERQAMENMREALMQPERVQLV